MKRDVSIPDYGHVVLRELLRVLGGFNIALDHGYSVVPLQRADDPVGQGGLAGTGGAHQVYHVDFFLFKELVDFPRPLPVGFEYVFQDLYFHVAPPWFRHNLQDSRLTVNKFL